MYCAIRYVKWTAAYYTGGIYEFTKAESQCYNDSTMSMYRKLYIFCAWMSAIQV